MPNTPTHPPTPDIDLRKRVWQELQRAALDRHHEWRTPVLASLGLDGAPQARTVVLRHADAGLWELTFYTDRRSTKVAELQKNAHASLVFWSKRLGWQIRLQTLVTVHTDGTKVAAAWDRVRQSPSAGDYLSLAAPGSPLQLQAGNPEQSEQHHLTVFCAKVVSVDWLELAKVGHRRALMTATTLNWRVP